MMTGIEIAALLKEYGPWGLCALQFLAIHLLVKWWREAMDARLADKDKLVERIAVALERQASTNLENTEAVKDLRDGQMAILKTTSEGFLTSAAKDQSLLEKMSDIRAGVASNADAILRTRGGAQ